MYTEITSMLRKALPATAGCLALLLALAGARGAHAAIFDNWTLNGSASAVETTLSMTPGTDVFSSSSAFLTTAADFSGGEDFDAFFSFEASGNANGFTFTVHNDPAGNTAVSGTGARLGYLSPTIANSVVVEFDMFDNGGVFGDPGTASDNQVSLHINGANVLTTTALPADIDAGGTIFVWIDYSDATDTLDVFMSTVNTKPGVATLSANFTLTTILGGTSGFMGFTAGGAAPDSIAIDNVAIAVNGVGLTIPEPGTSALLGAGLLSLVGLRRRRRGAQAGSP